MVLREESAALALRIADVAPQLIMRMGLFGVAAAFNPESRVPTFLGWASRPLAGAGRPGRIATGSCRGA